MAFVAAIALGLIGLLIFLFVYNLLLTGKREAQTAADAAALQAAKDIAQIAMPTRLGQIGIVNIAPNSNLHPADRADLNDGAQGLVKSQPVLGINTVLANSRICLLLAQDLDNNLLKKQAQDDLAYITGTVIPQLNARIQKATSPGMPIWKDALATYKINGQKANKGTPIEEQFQVLVGILDGGGTTGIKLPNGDDPAASTVGNIHGNYLPYRNYSVGDDKIVLNAVGPEPSLVDTKFFNGTTQQVDDVPVVTTVIKVQSTDRVTVPSANDRNGQSQADIVSIAAAEAGGGNNFSFWGGNAPAKSILTIGFSGGIPSPEGFPGKKLTIDSIIKLSAGPNAPARYPESTNQTWFQSVNNNSPDGTPETLFSAKLQRNLAPIKESPGNALSRGVADWIRTLGTKPNRISLLNALQKDLYQDSLDVQSTKACPNGIGVTTCMLNVVPAYNMAFGYTWATVACPQDAAYISYSKGEWKLANGQPISVACDLRRAALETLTASRLATRVSQQLVPLEINAQNTYNYDIGTGQYNDAWYLSVRINWLAEVQHWLEQNADNKMQEASTVLDNFAALTACGITPNVPFGNAKFGRPQPKSFQFDRFAATNAVFVPCPKFEPQPFNNASVPSVPASDIWENACDFAGPDGISDNFALSRYYATKYASISTLNTSGYWSEPDVPKKQHPLNGYDRWIGAGSQQWGPGPDGHTDAGYGLYAGNGEGWIDFTGSPNGTVADIPVNKFVFSMTELNCKPLSNNPNPPGGHSGYNPNSSFTSIAYHQEEPLPSSVLPKRASLIWQFSVDGDYSSGQGNLGVIKVQSSSAPTGDFAFSNNKLLNGEYLYIATNGLVTESGAGTDQSTTYWTVIAKDNAIDQSPDLNQPNITGNFDCVNFRIGCPLADSCCQSLCGPEGVKGFQGKTACPDIPPGIF